MAHDPRGCLFPSLGLCWETWSWAEQEASILSLNAVLVGPRVQSGGWALRGPGRQRGDLGESKTSAAGGIRVGGLDFGGHRGVLPDAAVWQDLLPHCELLLGREPPPSKKGQPPVGADLGTEGAGRQVLPW